MTPQPQEEKCDKCGTVMTRVEHQPRRSPESYSNPANMTMATSSAIPSLSSDPRENAGKRVVAKRIEIYRCPSCKTEKQKLV